MNGSIKKQHFGVTRTQLSIVSFTFGAILVGLYLYFDEEMVALGGLIAHLWITSIPVLEETV